MVNTNQKEIGTKSKQKENVNTETGTATKYRKLEKYSKEAQKGKIDYVLKDEVIGDTLTSSGIQGGKGVGEGLLKKSGFNKEEIRNYKEGKLKGEKIGEKRALNEMERASEMIFEEYKKLKNIVIKGGNLKQEKINLSEDIVEKINIMIAKENVINTKRENI